MEQPKASSYPLGWQVLYTPYDEYIFLGIEPEDKISKHQNKENLYHGPTFYYVA